MGGNARDRPLRGGGRKPRRAAKHPPDPSPSSSLAASAISSMPSSVPALSFPAYPSSASPADPDPGFGNPSPAPNPSGYDDAGWGYCTEEQLEDLLLKNLDFIYKEALTRLVSLGYDEDVALQSILSNGYCYGSMDVLSNILHNAIAHLNSFQTSSPLNSASASSSSSAACTGSMCAPMAGFTDLRHLQEYSLTAMVCLLQQVRPNLTRGDAMWCLLMSDLHVGRASTIEIPTLPPSPGAYPAPAASVPNPAAAPGASGGSCPGDYACPVNLCKFHAAATAAAAAAAATSASSGSSGSSGSDAADPRRFDLPPSLKSALRRNGSMFPPHSGFRPFFKPPVLPATPASPLVQQQNKEENVVETADKTSISSVYSDVVDSVVKAVEGMSLDDGAEDPKKEMILDVIRQIRDLEVQVKERKEWAQQKALQAARRVSNDLIELRKLRLERDENQRMKKGKQALEDTTMKRLTEMENALKKASGQVDRANAAVRRLETENAEIRAEMEGAKLNASESAKTSAEAAKREKKALKKVMVMEKQKEKLQEEIAEEKNKIAEMQKRLSEVKAAIKENELKYKQEVKAKEDSLALLDEERTAKEAAKVNASRRLEALRAKTELNLQRHKDDIQRLEEELSRLKISAGANQLNNSMNNLSLVDPDITKALKDFNGRVAGLNKSLESPQNLNRNRICLICKRDEVSVVFLPCAHQVTCGNCNEDHQKNCKACCPCCSSKIEERIRVYGTSS